MSERSSHGRPLLTLLLLAEAALAITVVVAASWIDRAGRSLGPESALLAYATAVAQRDLDGAIEQLDPAIRSRATSFVAWQLGNRYEIRERVVRTPSMLDRLAGQGTVQPQVVAMIEVFCEDGARWRATEELPMSFVDGGWRLLKPPLQPPEEAEGGAL